MNIDDSKPIMGIIEETDKLVSSQLFTYNEASKSYNEAAMEYGGLYGNEGNHPTMNIMDYKPL